MRLNHAASLLLLILGACAGASGTAPPPSPDPAPESHSALEGLDACAYDFESGLLIWPTHRDRRPELALFGCKGGLFLVDVDAGMPLVRLNESWWLEDISASAWNGSGTALEVTASFITGIGPTAAVPFDWQFLVSQDDAGVWQSRALEPGPADYVVEADGMVEITRPEQLQALGLEARGAPYPVEVDFTEERLIVKSVWLTSGDLTITDVRVARTARAYFATYTVKGPRTVSNDMQHAVIYLVLPRDVRYVSFEDPEYGARPFKARTGVIPHGTFVGAPTP